MKLRSPRPAPAHRRPARILAAALALGAVTVSLALPSTALALEPIVAPSSATEFSTPAGDAGTEETKTYVVVLRDQAAAARSGSRFDAASRRVADYTRGLEETQSQVAESVGADILIGYTLATNGFAADLTDAQLEKLRSDTRVATVVENEILSVSDAGTSTGYLGLEGDDGVWSSLGGSDEAGAGIVVGIIDTGIAPENPSFAGEALRSTAGGDPYRDGDAIIFEKTDGSQFRGTCETGDQFTADDCSTKLIGARYFVNGFGADRIGTTATGEYLSPRDGASHGSHTASTAAGNASVDAVTAGPVISGVAPAAKLAVYKACWEGPDPAATTDDGCATADLLAAIDAAVADNVDVINYSIGGGAAETTNSLTDQAFMRAAEVGIFVAAAAGNAGPNASTLDNASPWITTVAASTIPAPEGTVRLGDGTAFLGATTTVPSAGVAGPFVSAADVALAGATSSALCGPDSLDPARTAGTIVLCDRGEVDRVAKSAEVARAGGIGMVLVNTSPDSTDLDAHSVPTIHVDSAARDALVAYTATDGATATLENGNTAGEAPAPTPQVAGFSSRGPVLADGSDLIKPDVAAPGVNILAATANADEADPTWGYMSGTSMASPHVAGLAALYLGEHPTASPSEVKSALMTTARETLTDIGEPFGDPFGQGNGEVVPRDYLSPGLLYLNDVTDWTAYLQGIGEEHGVDPIDPSDLNLPSIGIGGLAGSQTVTRTVTATASGEYTASVEGLSGVSVTVSPSTLSFDAAGEEREFTVTFTRTDAELSRFSTGYLTWANDRFAVRSALAIQPVALDVPTEVAGTGTTGEVGIPVSVGEAGSIPLSADGLARGSRQTGTGTVGASSDRFAITIPAGTTFARFDLDAADDSADLDLVVSRRNQNGGFSQVGMSATGSADERVDLGSVPASGGTYLVDVSFYSAASDGSTSLDYTLTTFAVDPAAAAGEFTTEPGTLSGAVGDTPIVRAAWSGLDGGTYLGVVRFGDTGLTTIVTVDAGDEPVAAPGLAALEVGPEWVGLGGDLRVSATGLVAGERYSASIDGIGVVRVGVAPPGGAIDWFVTVPNDTTAGAHELTLAGGGAELSAPFNVTPVTIQNAWGYPTVAFDGTPMSRLAITYSGHGTIHYTIESVASGERFADETLRVGEVTGLPSLTIDTTTVEVAAGELVGVIAVVFEDGSEGPSYTTEVFTAETSGPSSLTITPTIADPDVVDVAVDNRTGTTIVEMLRYVGCDGRLVVASEFFDGGNATRTWDLTGFVSVEVFDEATATTIASFENTADGRCDTAGISISQNYWGTMTVGDETDEERPLTLEVSNRYAPYSGGFDLVVGEGEQRFERDPFFYEAIPVEEITERGPVISRSMPVREETPLWAVTGWEATVPPGIHLIAQTWINIPGVSTEDLRPGAEGPTEPGEPGGPGEPGDPDEPTPGPQPSEIPGDPDEPDASDSDPLASTGAAGAAALMLAAGTAISLGAFALLRGRRRRGGASTVD
ncbi:S8 family serine peptidase [Labedella phragmitis]|uniref:S8 family serine peptidase n=1 Tax=Labedella phragmitis TaxID=2498849 RepID=UPI00140E19D5|nr:S8 family serine peptidase [Labedella phragmitis]